jgi:1,4-dihydroxy-6-naphthoate synthase
MKQSLQLGFSPCPNDTFIFYALSNGRIDLDPFEVRTKLADVEELNIDARQRRMDVVKVSIHVLPQVLDDYALLRSGGATGRGCGPLLIARRPMAMEELRDAAIAIPGEWTTANLLLQLHGGCHGPRREMAFDEIMPSVADGTVDAGLIIHEGRFTYSNMGLEKIVDLGEWWEQRTGLPLPLGGILIKRSLGPGAAQLVEDKIRESLLYAQEHHDEVWPYIRNHAQEMEPQVIQRHIETFVNDFSLNLGVEGEKAVRHILNAAAQLSGESNLNKPLFWNEQPQASVE